MVPLFKRKLMLLGMRAAVPQFFPPQQRSFTQKTLIAMLCTAKKLLRLMWHAQKQECSSCCSSCVNPFYSF